MSALKYRQKSTSLSVLRGLIFKVSRTRKRYVEAEYHLDNYPEYLYTYIRLLNLQSEDITNAMLYSLAKEPKVALNMLLNKHSIDKILLEAIASNAEYSYAYATEGIKGRFQLGEPAILRDDYTRKLYTEFLSNLKTNN